MKFVKTSEIYFDSKCFSLHGNNFILKISQYTSKILLKQPKPLEKWNKFLLCQDSRKCMLNLLTSSNIFSYLWFCMWFYLAMSFCWNPILMSAFDPAVWNCFFYKGWTQVHCEQEYNSIMDKKSRGEEREKHSLIFLDLNKPILFKFTVSWFMAVYSILY